MTAVYEAGHLKRSRATKAEMGDRHDALYRVVADSQPTGVRFTYYRAVALGLVPKTESGYYKVQRALAEMRESGRMPYEWIVDSSRWMRKPDSWDDLAAALAEVAASYRKDLWRQNGVAVEVWCESESVAGVLLPVTGE